MPYNHKKLLSVLSFAILLNACAGAVEKTTGNQVAPSQPHYGAAKNIESTDEQATATVIDYSSRPTAAVKNIKSLDEKYPTENFPQTGSYNTQMRSVVFRDIRGGQSVIGFLWGERGELPSRGIVPVVFRNGNLNIGIPLVADSKQCCWSVIIPPYARQRLAERLQNEEDDLPALPGLPALPNLSTERRITWWWLMDDK